MPDLVRAAGEVEAVATNTERDLTHVDLTLENLEEACEGAYAVLVTYRQYHDIFKAAQDLVRIGPPPADLVSSDPLRLSGKLCRLV